MKKSIDMLMDVLMYLGSMAFGISFGMKAFDISNSDVTSGRDILFIVLLSVVWISGVVRSGFYKNKCESKVESKSDK